MLARTPLSVQKNFLVRAIEEFGWKLFPLQKIKSNYDNSTVWCGCLRGMKCDKVGKCPRVRWADPANFLTTATLDRWLNEDYTNFGIHLGHSGLVVADVDPRNGGEESWAKITDYDSYNDTDYVVTGSGGTHHYFTAEFYVDPVKGMWVNDEKWSTNFQMAPGVEILSGQHFVVSPFSVHKSGGLYVPVFDWGIFMGYSEIESR